ncbi:1-pyrroline-5-carboxylate dehydrogenase [Maribrevibacterium harenarium]|uniref:1-pyrroline-5-carboxylate dehydrogenase n=1 Tax=Maribrevibacterium harenarium TaxID=2589817 RepID=A0A501X407_9GAMM|nr:1-pyrroline-5-carboxylate dehydrogenase [Maribrevibacterium harenarium]TPE55214.1 1-pyrroline-5-carboxylate dehydrogenase [Maribrevibacterium harenarium]
MTIVKPVQIQVANKVFEAWDKLGVKGRAQLLAQAAEKLQGAQAGMAKWQLQNAVAEIGDKLVLQGPTGESNELSTHGRGAFLCTSALDGNNAAVGLVGAVFAALVAGNPVITVGPTGQAIMDLIANHVPNGVIQNVAESVQDSIIDDIELAGVAILCEPEQANELTQRLAQKAGLLCQLVNETDVENLGTIAAPHFILRFVTEQTITTNTTAIGGNATLLELGSSAE